MESNQAKQEYWAIRCVTCGEVIPVARLGRENNGAQKPLKFLVDPPVLEVHCEAGHKTEFIQDEMFNWWGPLSLGFRDNPAIRYPALGAI
jgi:hypothetical protein